MSLMQSRHRMRQRFGVANYVPEILMVALGVMAVLSALTLYQRGETLFSWVSFLIPVFNLPLFVRLLALTYRVRRLEASNELMVQHQRTRPFPDRR